MTRKIGLLFLTLAIVLFFRLSLAQGQTSCTTPEAITTQKKQPTLRFSSKTAATTWRGH
jgi:hypothetical protein